jgi:hypothetical protein
MINFPTQIVKDSRTAIDNIYIHKTRHYTIKAVINGLSLFTLRQITEKCWEFNTDIYLCFIDFKQAYDTITRKKLRMIMSTFGIPTKLRRIINLTMAETINQLKIQNQLTECFKTNQGLKQGDHHHHH